MTDAMVTYTSSDLQEVMDLLLLMRDLELITTSRYKIKLMILAKMMQFSSR